MSEQSKLGKELNRLMLKTGMTPLQTISYVMDRGALNVGSHKFIRKPIEPKK